MKNAIICFLLLLAARADAQTGTLTLSNIWNIPAMSRTYVGTTNSNTERGIAINPVSGHVLLVSRVTTPPTIAILDSETGMELGLLNASIIDSGAPGFFKLSKIGVADDGAIYAANLVTTTATPFVIYRWGNEGDVPQVVYSGDPGAGAVPRFGDSFDVRGSGTNTVIAAGSGSTSTTNRLAIFTTADGTNFTANTITPVGTASGEFSKGIWLSTNNTIVIKNTGTTTGRIMQYDLQTLSATILTNFIIDSSMAAIAVDHTNKLITGVLTGSGAGQPTHRLKVYDANALNALTVVGDFLFPVPTAPNGNLSAAIDIFGDKIIAVDANNGIVALKMVYVTSPIAPTFLNEPDSVTIVDGGYTTLTADAAGSRPLFYQWFFNETNAISQATNAFLRLTNITLAAAGNYSVNVSNAASSIRSSNAVVTVTAGFSGPVGTPLWALSPGSRSYLTTDGTQRGLAYNPVNDHLLISSRTPTNGIYVLNSSNGVQVGTLDVSLVAGGVITLNMIGVADDGVVYAGNLISSGAGLKIYRWDSDAPGVVPTVAFGEDGASSPDFINRWGDTFDVRGAGTNTQILMGSRFGSDAAVFTTLDGTNFTANMIYVDPATAPGGFAGLGITFGDTNTFWAKSPSFLLRHVSFDLAATTGTVLSANDVGTPAIGPIGYESQRKLIGGISSETPDSLVLLDASTTNIAIIDQEFFPTDNANINGTGSVDFGGGRVYALNSNNGLLVLSLNFSQVTVPAIRIARTDNTSVSLLWPGSALLQASTNVTGPYQTIGGATNGYSVATTTNAQMFFRLMQP